MMIVRGLSREQGSERADPNPIKDVSGHQPEDHQAEHIRARLRGIHLIDVDALDLN